MKNTKKLTMKIAIILLLIIIIDTTMPILSSQAGFLEAITEWFAEEVFTAISSWLVDLGDIIIEALQHIFVTPDDIEDNTGFEKYSIKYSPGIIFSGNVPGLDVNFISPKSSMEHKKTEYIDDGDVETIESGKKEKDVAILNQQDEEFDNITALSIIQKYGINEVTEEMIEKATESVRYGIF